MKIAIVTTLHGRPNLTRIVLDYYRRMAAHDKNMVLVAVGSSQEDGDLAREARWNYGACANSPLSQKHNFLFRSARQHNPDAIVLIGSDDLIHPNLIKYYRERLTPASEFLLGLQDLWFFSCKTGKMIRHKGFIGRNAPLPIGCGRIFTRALLNRLDWQPWGVEILNRGLDLTCSRILNSKGIPQRIVTMAKSGYAVDIKTDVNLTSMETFNFNCEPANSLHLDRLFPRPMKLIREQCC